SLGNSPPVIVTLPAGDYTDLAGLKAGLQSAINSALGSNQITVGDSAGRLTLTSANTFGVEGIDGAVRIVGHGYRTGEAVFYEPSSGSVFQGVTCEHWYFVIVEHADTIRLASTEAAAFAGVGLAIAPGSAPAVDQLWLRAENRLAGAVNV